jgi:radical SAM superfamily enzyme YgiQ (UPF0313 family)
MKVLLLRPHADSDELIPPFGLGYLAAAIRKNHEVKILDGIKEKLTPDGLAEFLKKERPDVVGIQIFTFQILTAKKYLDIIKKILPNAKIILGGPHPSCAPETLFDYFPQADFGFVGEAEISLSKLLDSSSLPEIPGLIWRDGEKTRINPQIFIDDLDILGMPAWDLIRPDTYPNAPHGGFFKNYPVAPIIITRGCPFSCTYCAGHLVSGRKIRSRSVGNVIEEIKLLYNKYGIREIHIEDDNFTFNKELVRDFCRELKQNGLNISWTCPNGVRLDTLTKDLLLTMKDVGLYSLSVGVESGSERILKDMKKGLTKETIKEKINLIRDCGLDVSGFFIIGYPTETKSDIMETIDFALELDLKRAGFFVFKPFPGTEITNDLIKRGELKKMSDEDWAKFVLADAVYAPPGFTREEIKKLRKQALFRFYLRPKILFKFLSEIRSSKHFWLILKRAWKWTFGAN